MSVRTSNVVREGAEDAPRTAPQRKRSCTPRTYANFVFDHLRPFQSVRVPDYTGKNGKLWCALFSEYGDSELQRLILEAIRERNTKLKFMQRNGERFTAACVHYYAKTFYKTTKEIQTAQAQPKELPIIVGIEMQHRDGITDERIQAIAAVYNMSPADLCRKFNMDDRAKLFETGDDSGALRSGETPAQV